jgi:hypothetical protein
MKWLVKSIRRKRKNIILINEEDIIEQNEKEN